MSSKSQMENPSLRASIVKQHNVLAHKLANALAFGDQRLHKCVGGVSQRLQTLRLERHNLVIFRVERLVNHGGLRLGKLTLNFETAKHRRHYNRLAGDNPHYCLNLKWFRNGGESSLE